MYGFEYPDFPALEAGIRSVLKDSRSESGDLVILERRPNPYQSSCPSEILTCRLQDKETIQLFLKYDSVKKNTRQGHWYSVSYEAEVYRDILKLLPVSIPKHYGSWMDAASGRMCLVLEAISHLRADKAGWPGMMAALRWLGSFHAVVQDKDFLLSGQLLQVYDVDYYIQWSQRTLKKINALPQQYAWLSVLCERFAEAASIMVEGPMVLVHGEYYPHNILVRDTTVYPIDWQSAAIGRGEIDLASLTVGWSERTTMQGEQEYEKSRWPNGTPVNFHAALSLARVYWPLRWLGAKPDLALPRDWEHLLDEARLQGQRAGLL